VRYENDERVGAVKIYRNSKNQKLEKRIAKMLAFWQFM
jgi:hypothetical protein